MIAQFPVGLLVSHSEALGSTQNIRFNEKNGPKRPPEDFHRRIVAVVKVAGKMKSTIIQYVKVEI
jgi:hypothetical protein